MAVVLADTNLLVYAHDPSDPVKQSTAINVLAHLHSVGIGRLSSQILAEFYTESSGRKKPLLTATKAAQQVENLASSWIVFDITPFIIVEAVRGVRSHKFSLLGFSTLGNGTSQPNSNCFHGRFQRRLDD